MRLSLVVPVCGAVAVCMPVCNAVAIAAAVDKLAGGVRCVRQVHTRVAVEEAKRLQREADLRAHPTPISALHAKQHH